MQLFYYADPRGNFGDDLNPRIWNHYVPELLDDDPDSLFIGIGTLLNREIPQAPRKTVFGAGHGYGRAPVLGDKWDIHCVRGPLTARALGLAPSLAITDPALLLRDMHDPREAPRQRRVSFMPHHKSMAKGDWSGVCAAAGVHHIDPGGGVDRVLDEIRSSRLVIAEAMHGAIVADAFRIPWVPVRCYDHVLAFKWQDWCASLGLDYRPVCLPSLFNVDRRISCATRIKSETKHALRRLGIAPRRWTPPIPRRTTGREADAATALLSRLASGDAASLSDYGRHEGAAQQLAEAIDRLKRGATVRGAAAGR